MKKTTRHLSALDASVTLILGTLILPPAAHAGGTSVALSHGAAGSTILDVWGSSRTVTAAAVSHGHSAEPWLSYCGVRGKVWGTLANGRQYIKRSGFSSGCFPIGFTSRTAGTVVLKHGTMIKGQSYHDGSWAPGIPQLLIRA